MEIRSSIFEFFGDVHDQPQVVLDERAPCFFIGFDALNERRLVLAGEGGGQRLRPVYVLQVGLAESEQPSDTGEQRMQADGVFHILSFLSLFTYVHSVAAGFVDKL